jgi:hypothetical protein
MDVYKSLTGNIPFKEYSLIICRRSSIISSANYSSDIDILV